MFFSILEGYGFGQVSGALAGEPSRAGLKCLGEATFTAPLPVWLPSAAQVLAPSSRGLKPVLKVLSPARVREESRFWPHAPFRLGVGMVVRNVMSLPRFGGSLLP